VIAAQLLAQARALGIVLTSAGGKLRYEAPAGRFTQELRRALIAHKAAVLKLLEAEQPAPRRIVRCRNCAYYIPSPPVHRASGAIWEMPGGCAQDRTSPNAKPPIYPCTGWYCNGWTLRRM
jgi:hypothetical protein